MLKILKNNSIKNKTLQFISIKRMHLDFDPSKDYYKIIGVDSKATEKQIKEQYYKLAKKHHPDLNKGVSTDFFKEMTAAYELLSDAEKRKQYDQLRSFSGGGFWNSNNKNSQQSNSNRQANQQSSNFNQSYQNYHNTNNKNSKTWNYTYVDPKTGQKRTFDFNNYAFKNFDEFIAKMRSEMKNDAKKSESFTQKEHKSKKGFFGDNYYENNKEYYQNKKSNDEFETNKKEFNQKLNDHFTFHSNQKFFKRINQIFLFGSIFLLFSFISNARRSQYNNTYYEQSSPHSRHTYQQNPYELNTNQYNQYQQNPYELNPNQYNQRQQHDPYNSHNPQQQFRPINYRANDNPYSSDVPPNYR